MPRVGLFVTCLVDTVEPEVGVAAVRLLEAAGVEVTFPEGQTCCGQPALSAGEPEAAAILARHHRRAFAGCDAVVTPSGSCAAMVRHWHRELLGDASPPTQPPTYELSEYLVDVLGRTDLGCRVAARVCVHDACHGLRTLGLGRQARALLAAAGAQVVEAAEPDTCCGFGGIFAARFPELSLALADAKLAGAAATGADFLVSGDLACLLHLRSRPDPPPGPVPVHLASLLASGLA